MGKKSKKAAEKEEEKQQRLERQVEEQASERRLRNQQPAPNSSNSSPVVQSHPSYEPPVENPLEMVEAAVQRSYQGLKPEEKELIRVYSNNYTIQFSKVWKKILEDYPETRIVESKARSFHKNQVQKLQSNRSPQALDPFISKVIAQFKVTSPQQQELTLKVQETVPKEDTKQFFEEELDKYLN